MLAVSPALWPVAVAVAALAVVRATALQGAEGGVLSRVLSNLSERARATLQEEVDLMRNARGAEVSEARRKVVSQARALEEQGLIELTREGGDDEGLGD